MRGLRPLRYEKRKARRRFIVLVAFFFVILFGILSPSCTTIERRDESEK